MLRGRDVLMGCLMGLCLFAGCENASSSKTEPPMKTAKSQEIPTADGARSDSEQNADPSATTERNFDGAVFQVPGIWEEKPAKSEFIKAEFSVPGPTKPGRLTLSAAGGEVSANIDRWKGQFQRNAGNPEAKESKLTVSGKEATLVELFGTFRDGFGGGEPQTDSAMLGVVIPLRETNYFVKLTGPRDTITEARDTFVKFVESAKFKE